MLLASCLGASAVADEWGRYVGQNQHESAGGAEDSDVATCGQACMALALLLLLGDFDEKAIEGLTTADRGGLSMAELRDFAEGQGLDAWGVKLRPDELFLRGSVIVLWLEMPNSQGESVRGHYVLVAGSMGDGRVFVIDPLAASAFQGDTAVGEIARYWDGSAIVLRRRSSRAASSGDRDSSSLDAVILAGLPALVPPGILLLANRRRKAEDL